MTDMAASMVYVVDDDRSVRDALSSLLQSVGLAVATFASATDFLSAPAPDLPACLVLDVRMPGQNGLDFQARLLREGRELPIIFITGHGDVPMSVRAMKAGAIEFLCKPFREQDLLDAIADALRRDSERRVRMVQTSNLRLAFASLTSGENEVVSGLMQGRTNREMANDLGLSEITIKVRRGRLMRKLGLSSLADLVKAALAAGRQ